MNKYIYNNNQEHSKALTVFINKHPKTTKDRARWFITQFFGVCDLEPFEFAWKETKSLRK